MGRWLMVGTLAYEAGEVGACLASRLEYRCGIAHVVHSDEAAGRIIMEG